MKKIYLIFALLFTLLSNAQCVISGPSQFYVGQTVTFSIPAIAQCADCYDWDINNSDATTAGNLSIVTSDQNATVSIKGLAVGSFSIKVNYIDETGCHECTFLGNVMSLPCCTFPSENFIFFAECRGTGPQLGGFIKIPKPINCDLSTVSKIVVELGQGTFSSTTGFGGLTQAVLTAPYSISSDGLYINPTLNFYGPCPYGSATAYVSVYFNNGCPTQYFNFSQELATNSKMKSSSSINLDDFKVTPNPTNSKIKIQGKGLEKLTVSIYNLQGIEIVKNANANSDISIENQPKGVYIYKIFNKDLIVSEGKIVKE